MEWILVPESSILFLQPFWYNVISTYYSALFTTLMSTYSLQASFSVPLLTKPSLISMYITENSTSKCGSNHTVQYPYVSSSTSQALPKTGTMPMLFTSITLAPRQQDRKKLKACIWKLGQFLNSLCLGFPICKMKILLPLGFLRIQCDM